MKEQSIYIDEPHRWRNG